MSDPKKPTTKTDDRKVVSFKTSAVIAKKLGIASAMTGLSLGDFASTVLDKAADEAIKNYSAK